MGFGVGDLTSLTRLIHPDHFNVRVSFFKLYTRYYDSDCVHSTPPDAPSTSSPLMCVSRQGVRERQRSSGDRHGLPGVRQRIHRRFPTRTDPVRFLHCGQSSS